MLYDGEIPDIWVVIGFAGWLLGIFTKWIIDHMMRDYDAKKG